MKTFTLWWENGDGHYFSKEGFKSEAEATAYAFEELPYNTLTGDLGTWEVLPAGQQLD